MERIVVVGASLAGLRTVEGLRRKGYAGSLVWIGEERRPPYDRPPLSKQVLTRAMEPDATALRWKGAEELRVDLRLGTRAVGLDTGAREVWLEGGERVAYDGLVIATGTTPRTLPGLPALAGIHTLRTLEDSLAIREALAARPRVVVVGAGFIGAEIAASCRALDLPVTVLETLPVPLGKALSERIGGVIAELHRSRGVDLRCGVRVQGVEGRGKVEAVVLEDGPRVPCDLLIVAIGVVPATQWLEGSGVALGDGVVCDATLATNVPGVVAVGDVASFENELFGERMRIEHWTNAVEQAKHVADTLLAGPGEARPFLSAPLFWSDQYELKIQGVGRPRGDDRVHICHGTLEAGKFVALYGRADRLMGAVTFAHPAKLFHYRKMIEARASWSDALAAAEA